MFCRNCGKDLAGAPEFCMNCGVKPMSGTSFCPGCGAPTTPLTETCTNCGLQVAKAIKEKTWKPTAAGILCIVAGAIGTIYGIVYFPLIILGVIAIVGGIYALRRRIWRLALAGSICILIQEILMAMIWVSFMSDGVQPILTSRLVGAIVVFGIPGILAIIFVIMGKREFK